VAIVVVVVSLVVKASQFPGPDRSESILSGEDEDPPSCPSGLAHGTDQGGEKQT
jgi:hypothetical protein